MNQAASEISRYFFVGNAFVMPVPSFISLLSVGVGTPWIFSYQSLVLSTNCNMF